MIELLTHHCVIHRENERIIQNNVELFKCGEELGLRHGEAF